MQSTCWWINSYSVLVIMKKLCLAFLSDRELQKKKERYSCFFIMNSVLFFSVSLLPPSPLPWRCNRTTYTHTQNLFSVSPNVTVHFKCLMVNHTCNEFNQICDLWDWDTEFLLICTCSSLSEPLTLLTAWYACRIYINGPFDLFSWFASY